MSKLANQWIDLFRAGTHGEKGTFTQADLQHIVDSYDPTFHEAPLCIGHPADDAPAFGWVKALRRVGDMLQFQPKEDIDPKFEEAVEKRRFPKRSAALYVKPEGYSLRHVAFLGAQPPEVKGLADIKFDAADKAGIEIEFSEEEQVAELNEATTQSIVARVIEGIKGLIPGGAVHAAKTFSEAEVTALVTKTATDAAAALKAEVDALKTQFSERSAAIATAETSARAEAAIARVKAKGAWVPAFDRQGIPILFAELAKTTETIEFGEDDAKKRITPLEALTTFMEGLKQIVPSAEVYTGQTARTSPTSGVRVNETRIFSADPNSIRFDEAIRKRMGEKQVDYGTAMVQITAEHPELAMPGGTMAGAV